MASYLAIGEPSWVLEVITTVWFAAPAASDADAFGPIVSALPTRLAGLQLWPTSAEAMTNEPFVTVCALDLGTNATVNEKVLPLALGVTHAWTPLAVMHCATRSVMRPLMVSTAWAA